MTPQTTFAAGVNPFQAAAMYMDRHMHTGLPRIPTRDAPAPTPSKLLGRILQWMQGRPDATAMAVAEALRVNPHSAQNTLRRGVRLGLMHQYKAPRLDLEVRHQGWPDEVIYYGVVKGAR